MKLYEFGPSRATRVRWTLQELGVPFEAVTVNLRKGEHRSPAFLKINPCGKLPALADGDFVMTESVAICVYLAEKFADKGLMPSALRERAALNQWLLFTATELEQPLWRITRHSSLYPEARRLPAEVQLAREDFAPAAQVLEAHLKDRDFVMGAHVSVADFVLAYTLDWANLFGLLAEFPRAQAYMERMYARPNAPMRMKDAIASVR